VNSSPLSSAAKSELAALSKKLVERASVTVTGYAKGNANLAKSRATAVASYLSNKDDTHGTVKTVTDGWGEFSDGGDDEAIGRNY